MAIDGGATPLDVTLTLLAVRRGALTGEAQVALLARCRGARAGTSARLLVDGGHADLAGARQLLADAQAIEARAARIASDAPLADRTDVAARTALREGLLDATQLRMALVDEGLGGEGSSLATRIERRLAGGATLPVARSPTIELDGATVSDLPDIPEDAPRLGRYPVTGTLGAGGMGEVLAVLDSAIGREVAAKVIRGAADETALRKFVLEARVTGQLQHPSIVPAHELGTGDDGRLYLTMKKVEGEELAASIARVRRERRRAPGRSGRHAVPEADSRALPHGLLPLLQAFVKVCEGVAYAHSKGVVHRDLKPQNIMVGAFGEVLVMDWGLAKVVGHGVDADPGAAGLLPDLSRSREAALKTLDGAIMGTPAYMPPEQAQGQIDKIDARADVYALGAILYELLALAPPYEGRNAWDVLTKVTEGPPPPPSAAVDGAWAVPWELEAVVTRAMARRRDDRYPDVPALAADVLAFLAGDLLSAVRYTRRDLLKRFVRRHWRVLGGVAVVLLSVIGALAYGVVSANRRTREVGRALDNERVERDRADQERDKASASLAKAKEMGAVETLERLRREAARDRWWTPLEWAGDEPTGELAHPPTRVRLAAAIREIDDWVGRAGALIDGGERYAEARDALDGDSDDPWIRLQRRVYDQLAAGAAELNGTREEVLRRSKSYADRLARHPDEAAWRAAAARIAGNPRYRHGLRPGTPGGLTPQVDLVPLGPDPHSGLEEFAHRGSGDLVRRGPDGRLRLTENSGLVFVLIPAGRYQIGGERPGDPQANPSDGPVHEVTIDAFAIGKHELTQAQWVRLGGRNPSQYGPGKVVAGVTVSGRHPVEQVTWPECAGRLARYGLVLPTEVQWEAAARGGTTAPWWTGPDRRALKRAENVADARYRAAGGGNAPEAWNDGHVIHAPVGSYPARHPFGLYDVAGNVREWCRDLFDEQAYRRVRVDRQGRRAGLVTTKARLRVARGGSWDYRAVVARSALRYGNAAAFRDASLGCRVARFITF